MDLQVLGTVGLTKDLPEYGLRSGGLGAVVQTDEADGSRWSSLRLPAELKRL